MEVDGIYNDSHMDNVLLKDEKIHCGSDILDSTLWVSNSPPSFHASASMVNFENENNTDRPFFTQIDDKLENCNDEFDHCNYHQPGKKRRLTLDQVQFLEKSFEVENKLEPERKIQLAKELSLQPRQVAIWFQNRRARYKTKVLEKDYEKLKASFDKLKADYDAICKENENMTNEVNLLTEKLVQRENKKAKLEQSDLIIRSPVVSQSKKPVCSPQDVTNVASKQEDASSSAKSDVFDSDSPRCNHSAVEPADSSHVFEPEASDFSQDEDDDNLSRSLLKPSSIFPKIEAEFYEDLQPNSCNLGFPVQDQGTWFWQY